MNGSEAGARTDIALSLVSGIALALAFPGPAFRLLAFVALVPFLLSLRNASRAGALLRGYVCGASFFFVLLYWIVGVMRSYGNLPWPVGGLILALLVFYLATFFALFAVLIAFSWRRLGPLALLASPIVWVGLELARGRLLTGFPWGLLGYSQSGNLPLLQAATLGGVYAVSFLVAGVNAAVALLVIRPAGRPGRAGVLSLLLLAGVAYASGWISLRGGTPEIDADAIPVAAIQGNVSQDRKWSPGSESAIIDDLVELTRRAASGGARVVVWPESASPLSFYRPARGARNDPGSVTLEPHPEFMPVVTGLVRDLGITLIAGSVDYRVVDGALRAYNSAFVINGDGPAAPPYDKVKLVPFGEYVPLKRVFFFVDRLVQGAIADFDSGTTRAPLPTPAGNAATFICYEAIFPEHVRRLAAGSAYLVNITNDAWFGRSSAPEQHLSMAVVRAVENRRYLVRAANTGISAIIDPYGRILKRSALDEITVLGGVVAARREVTLYARLGDWFAWGCAILTILHLAALRAAFSRPNRNLGHRSSDDHATQLRG